MRPRETSTWELILTASVLTPQAPEQLMKNANFGPSETVISSIIAGFNESSGQGS